MIYPKIIAIASEQCLHDPWSPGGFYATAISVEMWGEDWSVGYADTEWSATSPTVSKAIDSFKRRLSADITRIQQRIQDKIEEIAEAQQELNGLQALVRLHNDLS